MPQFDRCENYTFRESKWVGINSLPVFNARIWVSLTVVLVLSPAEWLPGKLRLTAIETSVNGGRGIRR